MKTKIWLMLPIILILMFCQKQDKVKPLYLVSATEAQGQFIHSQEYFDKEVTLEIRGNKLIHCSEYDGSRFEVEIDQGIDNTGLMIDIVSFPDSVNVGDLWILPEVEYWLSGSELIYHGEKFQQFIYQ